MSQHLIYEFRGHAPFRLVEEFARPVVADPDFLAGFPAGAQSPQILTGLISSGKHVASIVQSYSVFKYDVTADFNDALHMDSKAKARRTLADNVEALMRLRDWKQKDLARMAGISQKSVSNVLNARQSTQLDIIEAISQAFKMEPWQLMMPGLVPITPHPKKAA